MTDYADRLRKFNRAGQVQYEWFEEVADYIEKLEQDLALSKNALKRIGNGELSGQMLPSMPPKDAAQSLAHQTYLSIRDETDE